MRKPDTRRILCPTDFSAFSGPCFELAVTLAAWYEAALTVLHVGPDTMVPASGLASMANPMLLDPALQKAITHDLSSVVAPARRAGLRAEGELREGKPAAEIVRVAQELPADLIVMGTHGRSGFQRWVLGSVAETVLRRAPCPVLTVPARAVERPTSTLFKRVLCATDFSPASDLAIGYAASLATKADGRLLLVHVLDRLGPGARMEAGPDGNGRGPDFERAARVLRRALPESARGGYLLEEIVTHGEAAPEILRLATEREAGLIVMGVHGRSVLALMAFGSVSHQVVREAACPVLTVRPPSA